MSASDDDISIVAEVPSPNAVNKSAASDEDISIVAEIPNPNASDRKKMPPPRVFRRPPPPTMADGIRPYSAPKKPWVAKYRPMEFRDIYGNDSILRRFRLFAIGGNMPNLILAGPPGVGKTTSALALARLMLDDFYKDAVLELNASNERGIDIVRNKIKMFSQKRVTMDSGRHKIIFLDEADSMTEGAQHALRRTMEIFSKTTRFIFACNNSEKIIGPIQSRCAVVRFGKLPDDLILRKLYTICRKENVDFDEDGVEAVCFTAQGDLRQGINNLQATHDGFGKITTENVFKVCDEPQPVQVTAILTHCRNCNIDEAYQGISHLWKLGYAPEDIIGTIARVAKTIDLPEALRLFFIKEIGLTNLRIAEGVGTLVQLSGLMAKLCQLSKPFQPKVKK